MRVRTSSSRAVISGHTNAMVWVESIRTVHGQENKDYCSSDDEATNPKLGLICQSSRNTTGSSRKNRKRTLIVEL